EDERLDGMAQRGVDQGRGLGGIVVQIALGLAHRFADLAGYIEVGEAVREHERYLHNNATKAAALIDAALRHAVEAFVFSSTCAVYGLPQTELLSETHAIAPLSPYAESKARVETALGKAAAG